MSTHHVETRPVTSSVAPDQVRGRVPSFPAPAPLATPTDLSSNEVQAVVDVLNPLIADAYALYVKTKNYHWHLVGSHFRDFHLLFDEQADVIFASIDPMAERVRRIGGTTIRSIEHISQLQTIPDDNESVVSPHDMVKRLLEDNKQTAAALRHAIEVCDRNRDTPTSNVLQDLLDQTEKRTWFLYEISLGGHNMD